MTYHRSRPILFFSFSLFNSDLTDCLCYKTLDGFLNESVLFKNCFSCCSCVRMDQLQHLSERAEFLNDLAEVIPASNAENDRYEELVKASLAIADSIKQYREECLRAQDMSEKLLSGPKVGLFKILNVQKPKPS